MGEKVDISMKEILLSFSTFFALGFHLTSLDIFVGRMQVGDPVTRILGGHRCIYKFTPSLFSKLSYMSGMPEFTRGDPGSRQYTSRTGSLLVYGNLCICLNNFISMAGFFFLASY